MTDKVLVTSYSMYWDMAKMSHISIDSDNASLASRAYKNAISTIIFSAITLESFINYCLSEFLGNDVFYRLDKLDTLSKIVLSPYFICQSKFDTSRNEHAMLKWLFNERNEIVHDKPQYFTEDEFWDSAMKSESIHVRSSKAIKTVTDTVAYLNALSPKFDSDWLAK